jgi:hypothetical protein
VASLITDADHGALLSFSVSNVGYSYSSSGPVRPCAPNCTAATSTTQGTTVYSLATLTSDGGSQLTPVTIPSQSYPVQPTLQAEDGSYFGVMQVDYVTWLSAFDKDGDVRWRQQGDYQPLIATADGGVIARLAASNGVFRVTLDASGNVVSQVADTGTIYSWKGAYQYGSVHFIVDEIPLLAQSFAQVPGGNLTGNGFALNHHTLGLVFCNTGVGGDGSCPSQNNITNMSFSYLPAVNNGNYNTACDFSQSLPCDSNVAHPEWVDTVKIEALNTYAAAFASIPVIVRKGYTPVMEYGGSPNPPFAHTVYVDGSWQGAPSGAGCPNAGQTFTNTWSKVYFLTLMCGAQISLGAYGSNPRFQPPMSDAVAFKKLVAAIGRGIGNIAAHETGHQLSFQGNFYKYPLTNMDCDRPEHFAPACENNVDSVYEYFEPADWDFVSWNPPIHWQSFNACNLVRYFLNSDTCKETQ